MHMLSASDLLQIWEWGQGRSPVQQALVMLSAAHPGVAPARLAQLPIGERDAQLLALRSHTFGSQLQAITHCPSCNEALEYALSVKDIAAIDLENLEALSPSDTSESLELTVYSWKQENYQIRFRLPNSADFLAISYPPFLESPFQDAPTQLLSQCLISITQDNQTVVLADLPEAVVQSLSAYISKQDPQAEILLNLSCQACKHQWSILFDIVSFFWREIAIAAQRLLQEVHLLATVYSWREADILAMTPLRRQTYLEQIRNQSTGGAVGL